MLNLAVLLEDAAAAVPDHDAVVLGETHLTYGQVDAMASQVAGWLTAQGIGRGDRVALTCPNLPYFPVVYYGALKVGATVVPLNVLFKQREIAYHLADAGAVAYFCFEGTPELPMGEAGLAAYGQVDGCRHFVVITTDPSAASPFDGTPTLTDISKGQSPSYPSVPTHEADPAVILYTSGTTGQPKGATLSHSNMVQNAQLGPKLFGPASRDVHLVTLPLFHSFGQTVNMNLGFLTQSTLVLLPRFDAATAAKLLQSQEITVFAGVPTMYWALLNQDLDDASYDAISASLRVCVSGGSPMPIEVLRSFEKRFHVTILEGYGLSETSPIASFNWYDRPTKPGTVGQAAWGVRIKVVDADGGELESGQPGEVLIRGHNVMLGYHDRPAETDAAIDAEGWFRSGDIGVIDAEGYLAIVDRAKDMIIRGGFNVYPREVEEVLMTHPAVSLVAVVGRPDPEHGEEIVAYVIRRADVEVSETALVDWARDNMASYKYPRVVEFRDALPMTATGKILKRELG